MCVCVCVCWGGALPEHEVVLAGRGIGLVTVGLHHLPARDCEPGGVKGRDLCPEGT